MTIFVRIKEKYKSGKVDKLEKYLNCEKGRHVQST
jgi:hypothetical protein